MSWSSTSRRASDVIAEGALFLGHYPASAVTTEETDLFLLRRDDVFGFLDRSPAFARYVFESMSRWLDRLVKKIDELTLTDATARLSRYLGTLAESGSGRRVVLPVKKGDLAALLNMNQATLSRSFRRLQDDGVIVVRGRAVSILDADALHARTLPPID